MLKRLTLALVVASPLLTSGCAFVRKDKIHYVWHGQQPCESCAPAPGNADVIGLALSGGGARASVFGAAAIETLAAEGLMARVTHISSVSGGGFPAAYYALKKPGLCVDDASAPCESFADFKRAMRHNFLTDLTLRQVFKPNRFTSPTRRLTSLADALDDSFIGGARFADLPPSPVLLINGARYDDGRRFVFSNQAIPDEASDTPPFTEETLRTASFSLPGCPRATPADFSLALAVAVSAGFPPLLGPASIEAPETCEGGGVRYWHLGDGGILDNTGVETLEDYALHAKGAGPTRVIILSMDAGKSAAPDAMMQKRNLKLWTSDPGRVVDIVGMRARAYRDLALKERTAKAGATVQVLTMRYTDARISEWPASCGKRDGGAETISAHLATIPTNFKITDCDADLMELAARDVVTRTLDENRGLLEK